MSDSAIIFGYSGQDGYYLERLLSLQGIQVTCISRTGKEGIKGDVSDINFTNQIISLIKPNYIFHLAATSKVSDEYFNTNFLSITIGTLNILECAYKYCPRSKIFITGSGLQFINNGTAIKETDLFEAGDAYSLCRIQSVYAARYYRSKGLRVYVGYLFHHDSPRRKEDHLCMYIKKSIVKILNKEIYTFNINNLSVKKEWGYAGEIVKGIYQLLLQEEFFEATIGTGLAYSVEEWLDVCFAEFDLDYRDYVVTKDVPQSFSILYSDPTTINKIGWEHNCSIQQLAKLILHG